MNKAVFLDRDGVINEDNSYAHKISDFKIIEGVYDSLKKLQPYYKLFIITNQSGIGRGYYTMQDFLTLNSHMLNLFDKNEIKIERVYYCPHSPEEDCECRKPKPKFIKDAELEFRLNLKDSWMIGDKISDLEMGENAGCRSILIDSRYVRKEMMIKFKSLAEATNFILDRYN